MVTHLLVCVVIVDLQVWTLGRWRKGVESIWKFMRLSWCSNGITGCAHDTARVFIGVLVVMCGLGQGKRRAESSEAKGCSACVWMQLEGRSALVFIIW